MGSEHLSNRGVIVDGIERESNELVEGDSSE